MASNAFNLEGKVALVTGANTGLGQGIALALAEAGADIAAAGIVAATETEEKVKALGRRFINIEANLITIEQARTFGVRISFWDHARAGIPITLASVGVLILWLWVMS